MSPKIPPFPPREFATIDEVLAGSSIGSADREVPSPGPRAETPGKVYIAGGGPGALDLLTLRAAQALGEADVVLLDHLAPQEFAKLLSLMWVRCLANTRCRSHVSSSS